MDYQTQTLFGGFNPNAQINAQTMNPQAAAPDDWLHVMTTGIQNDVISGINGLLTGAVQSGQLPQNANGNSVAPQSQTQQMNLLPLLLIGAVILFAVRA